MPQPRTPDGRYTFTIKSGSIITAGAIGIVAAVGLGTPGAGVGAGARSATISDAPTLSVQVRTSRGQQRSARTQRNLTVRGLRGDLQAEGDSSSCSADARGDVRDYLASHPCRSVYRALFVVRRGDVSALVAVAWIDMEYLDDAVELEEIVDRPGTGNVNQLPAPRGVRVIEVGDPFWASTRQGRTVVTVEVEPVTATAPNRALARIAEDAAGAG